MQTQLIGLSPLLEREWSRLIEKARERFQHSHTIKDLINYQWSTISYHTCRSIIEDLDDETLKAFAVSPALWSTDQFDIEGGGIRAVVVVALTDALDEVIAAEVEAVLA